MRCIILVIVQTVVAISCLAGERLLLDAGRDLLSWRVYLGGEYPGATGQARVCDDAERGQCVEAEFAFGGESRYAGIQWTGQIPETRAVGFWLKTEGRNSGMIRVRDAKGQEHLGAYAAEPAARGQDRGAWSRIEVALTPQVFRNHWGGPNDGKFHFPLTAVLVGLNRTPPKSGGPAVETARMRLSCLYAVVDKIDPADAWSLVITPGPAGGVVFPGEKAAYTVTATNRTERPAPCRVTVEAQKPGDGKPQRVGEWEGNVEGWGVGRLELFLPTNRLGYVCVRARVEDPARPMEAGNEDRATAISGMAVVQRPRYMGQAAPDCYFGLQLCPDVAVAERLGAKAIRVFPGWRWTEPRQGMILWDIHLDPHILPAIERQMQVLLTLQGTAPAWAAWRVEGKPKLMDLPDPARLDAWKEYCRKVAERYRGRLAAIEIQNEPDLTCWRHPDVTLEEGAEYYAKLLKAGYEGVKAGDPNVPVAGLDVSGGDFDRSFEYTDAVLTRAKQTLDLFTGHPYASPRNFGTGKRAKFPVENLMAEKCRMAMDLLERHGKARRMWIGELGWALDMKADPLSEFSLDFAACVTQALVVGKSVPGVERFLYFTMTGCNETGYEYGLLRGLPMYPLPAACAYATCAYLLEGTKPVEPVSIEKGVYRASFSAPERDELVVVWWAMGETMNVILPQVGDSGRWYDSFMQPAPAPGEGVRVGRMPVYLVLPLKKFGVRPELLTGVKVAPAEALTIQRVYVSGREALSLDVANRTNKVKVVSVLVDGEQRRLEIPPGADGLRCETALPKPLRVGAPRMLTAKVLAEGVEREHVLYVRLNALSAPPEGFQCDGDLREWSAREPIVVTERRQVLPPDPGIGWDGPEDLSMKAFLTADDKGLYFAAVVTDDIHVGGAPGAAGPDNFWNFDSIQIAVDPNNNSGDTFDGDDREVGLVLGAEGPCVFLTCPKPRRPLATPLGIKRQGAETVYEAVFAWDDLGIKPPRPGQVMAINFIANDNDGQGRAYWMGLTPGIGEAKVPASYREFCFERPDSPSPKP